MNNFERDLNLYNRNIYINILKTLLVELEKVEDFLTAIKIDQSFHVIDDLAEVYESIFANKELVPYIDFHLERIYKALYLRIPGPHDKGNSYFHLTLVLKKEIIWLDNLYKNLLYRITRLFKHLFSKIDNFFISQNATQLDKYRTILTVIKKEVSVFVEFSEHREIVAKRKQLDPEKLNKIPFGGLFYIAHADNIQSILHLGILSHNQAHENGFVNVDISNRQVNEHRNRVETSLGGNIHDFAPLFINPRNANFYYWCKNENPRNLILLKVNPHILLLENVAFSDGNAAVRTTSFYKNIEEFNTLNWTVIHDNYWTNHPDGKRIKCSEVLVRDKIPVFYINDIFVYDQQALNKILPMFPNHLGIIANINKRFYY